MSLSLSVQNDFRVGVATPNQEMIWWSISAYFKEHASEEAKRKYRNHAQKKKYIVDVLQMPLQFDRGVSKQLPLQYVYFIQPFFVKRLRLSLKLD